MARPRITILTTGGTIASAGASPSATTIYELDPHRNPVLEAVPLLAEVAEVSAESFLHLASHDIPLAEVFRLARRIAELRAGGEAEGVVVTHGTDTLEESAFLVDLLLPAGAPVVFTGAARPSSALSADGPLNLLNAVRVAASPEAAGRGVLVCLNDRIAAARHVSKTHSSAPDAFQAGDAGFAGAVTGGEVAFFHGPRAAPLPPFPAELEGELPRVEIVVCHLGMETRLIDFAVQDGAAGLVFAATGNGSIPNPVKPALGRAREAGVVVVRSSRVGNGAVTGGKIDEEWGTIPAGRLSPQKARLLLMLGLRAGWDRARLAEAFRTA